MSDELLNDFLTVKEEEVNNLPHPTFQINGKCACLINYCDGMKNDLHMMAFLRKSYRELLQRKPYQDYIHIDNRVDEEFEITIEQQEEHEQWLLKRLMEANKRIELHNLLASRNFANHEKRRRQQEAKKAKEEALEKNLGYREFTLTYSPTWFGDEEARRQMEKALERLTRYYKNDIISFQAVGEVGDNGLSHVHGIYLLANGRKITDKNFKRAYQYWDPKKKMGRGFQGGHHATVSSVANFTGYIEKEADKSWCVININNALHEETNNQANISSSSL